MPRRPAKRAPCPSLATDGATQAVRLADVFVLGPVMIGAAVAAEDLPAPVRVFLGLSGAATIVFNGVNFLRAASVPLATPARA